MGGPKVLMIQNPKKDSLSKLTKSDQDEAVRDLLANEEFDAKALNVCFEATLPNMAPRCLDVIAKFAKIKNVTFSLTTPYHHLITSGKRYPENKLVECIRALIDNGFDVHEPGGWYPLYTLVQHARETQIRGESMDAEYESLSLLLAAGADPNYRYDSEDEVYLRAESASAALEYGFGMFSTPSNFHDYCKYFAKYVELFVTYGCDVSEKNNMGRSLLEKHFGTYNSNFDFFYDFYQFYVKHGVVAITPHWYKSAGCLIYGGADLHFRNQNKLLPLTTFTIGFTDGIRLYFDRKSDTLSNKEHEEKQSQLNDIATALLDSALSFLKFMNIREAQEVLKQSLEAFDLNNHDGKLTNFRTVFKNILLKHFSSFFCLKTLCAVKVWRCGGKRFTELGLPAQLEDDIRGMFHLTL